MATYFSWLKLLSPPTERATFSDRRAYVCAELCKLVYFPFEGSQTLDAVLAPAELAEDFIPDESRLELLKRKLSAILTTTPAARQESENTLGEMLESVGFEQGTEGFLCSRQIPPTNGNAKTLCVNPP